MSVFLQHFTYFSQVFVNLGRVKISQIRPKLDIYKRIDNIYCPIRAVIRNRTQGSLAYPTAALLRSLQWGSDGRSRVAEPMGRREVCLYPQRRCFAACSGFRIVGPASRNIGGAMGDGCVMCEMHCAMCRCAMACVRCAVSWRDTSI